jgi:hypothetical protein
MHNNSQMSNLVQHVSSFPFAKVVD